MTTSTKDALTKARLQAESTALSNALETAKGNRQLTARAGDDAVGPTRLVATLRRVFPPTTLVRGRNGRLKILGGKQ